MLKISVITVCRNSENTIGQTLISVKSQTYREIEHIVIDGRSNDNTLAVVHKVGKHVAHVISERDKGIYDAMNKGLALATGDVIGFLNSDDIFANAEVVARIAETMKNPSIDACYGDLIYVDQSDMSKVVRYWKSGEFNCGDFFRGWVPAHPTFYARRKVYQEFGGFDLNINLAADFDILLRFFEVHKISVEYIPEILIKMRLGGATNASWNSIYRQNREIAEIFKKYGFSIGWKLFINRFIRRITQFLRRPSINK
jgi:glycosyltransferase involved in cell wall biosynthesis